MMHMKEKQQGQMDIQFPFMARHRLQGLCAWCSNCQVRGQTAVASELFCANEIVKETVRRLTEPASR